jgi:hypothetical protein
MDGFGSVEFAGWNLPQFNDMRGNEIVSCATVDQGFDFRDYCNDSDLRLKGIVMKRSLGMNAA